MFAVVVATTETKLEKMREAIRDAIPRAVVRPFTDPLLALRHIQNHPVDDVFVSTVINRITFMDFIRAARNIRPGLPVAVFSEQEGFGALARASGADAFVTYPPTAKAVRDALSSGETVL